MKIKNMPMRHQLQYNILLIEFVHSQMSSSYIFVLYRDISLLSSAIVKMQLVHTLWHWTANHVPQSFSTPILPISRSPPPNGLTVRLANRAKNRGGAKPHSSTSIGAVFLRRRWRSKADSVGLLQRPVSRREEKTQSFFIEYSCSTGHAAECF